MTMARYWAIWGIIAGVVFLAFLIPEFIALFTGKPRNTLSEVLWRAEKLGSANPLNWTFVHLLVTVGLSLFLVWLIGHFGWGIWR